MEFALFSINSESVELSKKSNLLVDKRITFLLHNKKKLTISLLIFKNIIGFSIAILATYFLLQMQVLQNFPAGVLFGLIALTSLIVVACNEIVPRTTIRISYYDYAKKTAFFLWIVFKVFHPVTQYLLNLNFIHKRRHSKSSPLREGDLKDSDKTKEKESFQEEDEPASTATNLESLSLKKVMVNRLDIQAFDWELSFEEILKEVNKSGFSRIPVYKESIDNVEGILYVKDLLIHLEEKETFDWHKVIRPCFFIPESKKIDDLLKEFQEKKVHMAIIVDEYGGTSGLITMEDILEEIVGEINDEFDQNHDLPYSTLDENTFIFEGDTPLSEFLKIQGIDEDEFVDEKGSEKTISTFLIDQLSRIPEIGEQIYFHKFEFTIIGVEEKKISRVKIKIKDQSNKKELV
jgi:gliding motility-associated protein GldE